MLPTIIFALTLILPFLTNAQGANQKYTKVPAGYLMVLRMGDDVFTELSDFALKERIPSASVSGMGFVNAKFGFFDFKQKIYKPREFKKVELASMTGSIAWEKDTVALHLHGIATDKKFRAYGGHLLAATVDTGSLELLITVHDKRMERSTEDPPGAKVLQLGGSPEPPGK